MAQSARKFIDCRNFPSEMSCTLAIAGEPDELERAAVEHAISVHGETDTVELRRAIRKAMHDESEYRATGYRPQEAPRSRPESRV